MRREVEEEMKVAYVNANPTWLLVVSKTCKSLSLIAQKKEDIQTHGIIPLHKLLAKNKVQPFAWGGAQRPQISILHTLNAAPCHVLVLRDELRVSIERVYSVADSDVKG